VSALNRIVVAVSVFLVAGNLCAAQTRTDAQIDGLGGPVKSVVSATFQRDVPWHQPNGTALIWPISCQECDYDPDGARVRSGQRNDDGFHGDTIAQIRDAQGRVSERRVLDSATGTLRVHEVLGPFGLMEQTYYNHGKVSSSLTLHYDSFGHLSETFSFDSRGQQVGHGRSVYTDKGVRTEDSLWDQNGLLKRQEFFDPGTHVQTFTTFDDAGIPKLAWTHRDGKMISFWERSDEANQYGDCVDDNEQENGTRETRCFANGGRVRAVICDQFMEPRSLDIKSAEWRDGDGKLLYAAYYDYQLDSRGNWNHRSISVISPELPERTLYEEDTRILSYW
jgi:hypothetical protein